MNLVVVPAPNRIELQGKLTDEEEKRVQYAVTVIDVLGHAVEGFKRKQGQFDQLFTDDGIASIGTCDSLSYIATEGQRDPDVEGYPMIVRSCQCEAVVVPCYPRKSREMVVGIAAQPSHAKTAVRTARLYLHQNYDRIKDLILRELHRLPYVDLETRQRLRKSGKPFSESEWVDMDLVWYVPPQCNIAFLCPAMLIAIISCLWRLPPLPKWSMVGNFDPDDGTMYGYPSLDDQYIRRAIRAGLYNIVVPSSNYHQIMEAVRRTNLNLEELGVRLIGCATADELICWTILQKDPKQVLQG